MNKQKWKKMERAIYRSEPRAMWAKLQNTHSKKVDSVGYKGHSTVDPGYYYAPYIPVLRNPVGIIGDTTA